MPEGHVHLSSEEGAKLVKMARRAIQSIVSSGLKPVPTAREVKDFPQKAGVFVSIYTRERGSKDLRGCIGFVTSDKPLANSVIDSSIAAATEDPRFSPVSPFELPTLVVEVSVLTPLERVLVQSPRELPSKIRVGRDGLVISWRFGSGLLLPQVPVEYGWDASEFLSQACMKAGGTPDLWLVSSTKVFKFQAEVFSETAPAASATKTTPPSL